MISKILLIVLMFSILLIMCISLNVLQTESFLDNTYPLELKKRMEGVNNDVVKEKVLANLSQRVSGIPLPSSYKESDPVYINGLGVTSDRLVGATKNVYGNNGTVSCTKYCGGINYRPWNNELPNEWLGAKCVKTSNSKYSCDAKPQGPIQCTCAPSGRGWNP